VSVGHRFRSSCGELSRREPCLIYFWSDSVSRCRLPFFADDLDQPPHFSGSAHGYAHEAATHVLAPVAKQNSLSLQFAKQRRPSRAKIGQQKIARTRVGLDAKPTKFFRYPHAQALYLSDVCPHPGRIPRRRLCRSQRKNFVGLASRPTR